MIISNSVIFLASDLPRNSSEPESPGPVSQASLISQRPAGESLSPKALSEPALFLCVPSCWKGETKSRPRPSSHPLPVPPSFCCSLPLSLGSLGAVPQPKGNFSHCCRVFFWGTKKPSHFFASCMKDSRVHLSARGLRVERSLAFASHRAPSSRGCNPRASA